MSQVSKRIVNKKIEGRVLSLFLGSIISCNNRESASSYIEELLSPAERVMLAKRFSIMFMLSEGYDYESISDTLKVSRSTIGTVSTWMKMNGTGIHKIIMKIKRDEAMRSIWAGLQDGIMDLLVSSRGANWSNTKSMLWQARRERQKAF